MFYYQAYYRKLRSITAPFSSPHLRLHIQHAIALFSFFVQQLNEKWAYQHINWEVSLPIPLHIAFGTARSFYSRLRAVNDPRHTWEIAGPVEVIIVCRTGRELHKFWEQGAGEKPPTAIDHTGHRWLRRVDKFLSDHLECTGVGKPPADEEEQHWRQCETTICRQRTLVTIVFGEASRARNSLSLKR